MVRAMPRLVKSVAVLSGLLCAASFGGAVHPAGDALAVFRVPLAVVFGLSVIWTDWPRWLRWPFALACIVLIAGHVLARVKVGTATDHDFVLYQQNLLFNRTENAAFLEALTQDPPDFITLQEVSTKNLPILSALEETHPHQHHCPITPWIGEAVLSRDPMVAGTAFCSDPDGLAGMQVETPLGRVWLISVHLRWPWPYTQARQVDGLLSYLDALEGPVIMAGDFNAVAWSHTLRRMGKASGTARVGAHVHSFARLPVPIHLGIDHVLTSPAYAQEVMQMPLFGSDHYGIKAYLTRPRND